MAAKRILTTRATAGMIVSEDVYTSDNRLVIPKDTVLTDAIIERMKELSIFSIYIKEDEIVQVPQEETEEKPVSAPASKEQNYFEKVRETEDFKQFYASFTDTVDDMKESFNQVIKGDSDMEPEELLDSVGKVLDNSRNALHVLDLLHCMRGYNDITFVHCLNVALLSNMIGRLVYPKAPESEIQVLTMAGLLHDIGKLMISEEVIMKKERLSYGEFNMVKTHVLHGSNILSRMNLDDRIVEVAMRHHERWDGSGYPGGYKGEQISPFARIVAIADVYDAMTSPRPYRDAICPFSVIEHFEREGYNKYDSSILIPFLDKAVLSYLHNDVHLTDGRTGKVIMINKEMLSRPVVQVGDEFVNLMKMRDISIDKIIT